MAFPVGLLASKGAGFHWSHWQPAPPWLSDRQLAWALPGAWVLMYVFIVTTQWYPGFIWLNWPLQIVYAYVFFIRSAP